MAAAALIAWLALPTRTVTPVSSDISRTTDRVLPLPRPEPEGPHVTTVMRQQARHRPRARKPSNVRIPIDIGDAPQLAAMTEPADLTVKPIEIAELTIAPLEPEKESR